MSTHTRTIKNLTLTLSAISLLAGCQSNRSIDTVSVADSAISVRIASPTATKEDGINISGQVESGQIANISTRVMGVITMLNVKTGDHVNRGELLVMISDQDIVAKKAQTEAMISEAGSSLLNAEKNYNRFTALFSQQSATAQELENATLQYNAAKSRLESARQMRNEVNATLEYTRLKAPFSGVVTKKNADAGSMASPGTPLLTIEQSGTYQITASVPENLIGRLKIGKPAAIRIQSANKTFQGTINQINQSSVFTGGQYIIKIKIPDNQKAGLYAGMYADINIPSGEKTDSKNSTNSVLVPTSCLVNRDQLTGLYTVGSGNRALLRWVRVGRTIGEKTEIISGLNKDEDYVLSADGALYDGVPVKWHH